MKNKYVLMTEIEPGRYEVFDIAFPPEGSPSAIRILEGMADGNIISSKNATGFTGVAAGSYWDGSKFNLPEVMAVDWPADEAYKNGIPLILDDLEMGIFVIMSNSKVFYINICPKNSIFYDKYEAAFTNNVTLKEFPEGVYVSHGYIWDGNNWIVP